jgi:hypothetical protein
MKRLVVALFLMLGALSPLPAWAFKAPYFESEVEAQVHCPKDSVVWLNSKIGVFHFFGQRYYANTRRGAFVCEAEALQEGDRPTRYGQ